MACSQHANILGELQFVQRLECTRYVGESVSPSRGFAMGNFKKCINKSG